MEFTTGRNGRTSALPGCPLARSLSPAVSVSRKTAGSIPRPRLSTTRGASTLSPKTSLTTSTMLEVRLKTTFHSSLLSFLYRRPVSPQSPLSAWPPPRSSSSVSPAVWGRRWVSPLSTSEGPAERVRKYLEFLLAI